MEEGNEDVKFIDASQYTGSDKEKITFRDIVLSQVKKILLNANCEMRGGYWETKEVPIGNMQTLTQKTYIPDTREVYSNSVEALYDLLYAHFDELMKKDGEDYEDEMDEAFNDNTVFVEPDREDQTPEEAKKTKRRSFGTQDNKVSYRQERVKICRELFRCLCCFLKRQDYFKGKTFEEEV